MQDIYYNIIFAIQECNLEFHQDWVCQDPILKYSQSALSPDQSNQAQLEAKIDNLQSTLNSQLQEIMDYIQRDDSKKKTNIWGSKISEWDKAVRGWEGKMRQW